MNTTLLPSCTPGLSTLGRFLIVRKTTEKRWGFLFKCLTSCAVHVEIVRSVNANSCVMGVELFVSCLGIPTITWSDNGINFVGSEKQLVENIEKKKIVNIAVELQ